ncbi:MAG: prepilin-type N-terminal cleavage/methylation domain-containing protein [Chthoniobacteraceae bacterium]
MQNPSSSRAFTLIEMMLALAIAITVTVLAIPNMRGFAAEKRLHETFEKFDTLARKAQLNAVSGQRSWSLSWQPDRILLQPDEPTPEERENGGASLQEELPILNGESYTLDRHASLLAPKDTPPVWTFWRSGTCEPVIVGYSGPDGTWSAQYNPLTGHGEIVDQVTR